MSGMNFCADCGGKLHLEKQPGDAGASRHVCQQCHHVYYQNPIVLVAVYVCVGESILWIRRGIAPAAGRLALPGGYMEKGETPEQAASRELEEETGVRVTPQQMQLVSVSSVLHMTQTHLVFRCHLPVRPQTRETREALQCCWYSRAQLPWSELAFATITPQINEMYEWLQSGDFAIRIGFVDETGSHYRNYPLARGMSVDGVAS